MVSMLFMAFTHTHARMLKHKTYRVLQAKIEAILEIMHDPKYTEMSNATHAKMQLWQVRLFKDGI